MVDTVKYRVHGSVLALTIGLALTMVGCSGSTEETPTPTDAPEPTGTPYPDFAGRVTLLNLDYNQTIVLDQTKIAEIEFKVDNYMLAAAGNCGSAKNCGRVEGYVDDTKVAEGFQSPLNFDFTKVATIDGAHKIVLKLIFDDGSQTGATAEQQVRVTAPTPPEEVPPGIVLTSPLAGELLQLGDDPGLTVPVTFTTTNITLAAPGSCGGVEGYCGHVHLLVDGENGNSDSAPYNNAAVTDEEPTAVYFQYLEDNGFDAYGSHEITLELHHDDHSAWTVDVNGQAVTIASSATVNAVLPTDPFIHFDLGDTTNYEFQEDGYKTIALDFTAENFTLKAPGSCAGASSCGHVHVKLDGDAGNAPEAPYNNALVTDSAAGAVHFGWLEYAGIEPSGRHIVTFELHNDDHSQVSLYSNGTEGINIVANTTVNASYAANYKLPVVTIQTPADGASATLSDTNTVNVRFSVTDNFIPKNVGTCDANTYCGKFCLQIDGDAGNVPGQTCNVSGTASPLAANFAALSNPTGNHKITVFLTKPDGTPYAIANADGTTSKLLDATDVSVRGAKPAKSAGK